MEKINTASYLEIKESTATTGKIVETKDLAFLIKKARKKKVILTFEKFKS